MLHFNPKPFLREPDSKVNTVPNEVAFAVLIDRPIMLFDLKRLRKVKFDAAFNYFAHGRFFSP